MYKQSLIRVGALVMFLMPFSANAQQTFLDFNTCFDLEGGVVAEDTFGFGCTTAGDIRFAFHSGRTNPATLFWNELEADLALIKGVPFDGVDSDILADNLLFADHLNDTNYPLNLDVSFNGTDTAIVLTGDGNYYKVGYAICEMYSGFIGQYTGCIPTTVNGTYGVRFRYEQLVP